MKVDGKDTSTLDKLEQLLNSHPSIINFAKPEPAEGTYLNRNFEFEIRGIKYKITWFVNLMNLYIGEFEMLFDEIAISSTVPRGFKSYLQFYYQGKWVADIPLESYWPMNRDHLTENPMILDSRWNHRLRHTYRVLHSDELGESWLVNEYGQEVDPRELPPDYESGRCCFNEHLFACQACPERMEEEE